MQGNSLFQKAGLVVISVLLSFFILEMILRVIYPAQTHYLVWQPGLRHQFFPDTGILGGLEPATSFTIDRYGLRTDTNDLQNGPDLFESLSKREKNSGAKYYLCIGASTTEGLYLDDSKTWPAQFAQAAKSAHDSVFGFIGNLGKSGCTMRENYIQLKYCVPQYKRINTVFVMAGLNDMTRRLSQDTSYKTGFQFTPVVEDSFVNTIFLKQGRGQGKTWFRRSALFYVFQNAYHRNKPLSVDWMLQDNTGKIYETWRKNRQEARRFLDTLPDMTDALDEYGRIINLMIDEAQKQKLQIIFINESAIWRDSMSEIEISKLWQGGIGKFQMESGHVYYSPKALRQGLELYNQKLASVCVSRGVHLIDIDSKLPHSLSVFYDDCHFTDEGAREIGNIVYQETSKR
jgi:lysophospholipase L1-like esterase